MPSSYPTFAIIAVIRFPVWIQFCIIVSEMAFAFGLFNSAPEIAPHCVWLECLLVYNKPPLYFRSIRLWRKWSRLPSSSACSGFDWVCPLSTVGSPIFWKLMARCLIRFNMFWQEFSIGGGILCPVVLLLVTIDQWVQVMPAWSNPDTVFQQHFSSWF